MSFKLRGLQLQFSFHNQHVSKPRH